MGDSCSSRGTVGGMRGESDPGQEGASLLFVKHVGPVRLDTSQVGGRKRETQRGRMSGREKERSDGNKGRLCSHDITFFVPKATRVVSHKVGSS